MALIEALMPAPSAALLNARLHGPETPPLKFVVAGGDVQFEHVEDGGVPGVHLHDDLPGARHRQVVIQDPGPWERGEVDRGRLGRVDVDPVQVPVLVTPGVL